MPGRATVPVSRKGRHGWTPTNATVYPTSTRRVMVLVSGGNQLRLTPAEAADLADALREAALEC